MLTPEQIAKMDEITGLKPVSSASKTGAARFAELEEMEKSIPRSNSALDVIKDVGIGAAKGITKTAQTIASPITSRLPEQRNVLTGEPVEIGFSEEQLQPTNTAQKVGMGAEQVAEFLVPGSAGLKVAKVPGIANLAARAGVEALGSGAVTLAQTSALS